MLKKFLTDQIVMGANVPLPANSPFGSLAACWGEIIQLPLIPTQKKMRNLLIDLIVSPAPQLFSVSSSLFVDVCAVESLGKPHHTTGLETRWRDGQHRHFLEENLERGGRTRKDYAWVIISQQMVRTTAPSISWKMRGSH